MKESMMMNLVFVNTLMNKLLIIPIFFLTMCGTAPVIVTNGYDYERKYDDEPSFCKHPDE